MPLEPDLPIVTADQGDYEKDAEQDVRRAQDVQDREGNLSSLDMPSAAMEEARSHDFEREPEGKRHAEELISVTELHPCAPLQQTAQHEHQHEKDGLRNGFQYDRGTPVDFGWHGRGL